MTTTGLLLEGARTSVVAYAQRMVRDRLVVGTSGNISCREGDLVAVTPSGTDYATMTPEEVVVVDLNGNQVDGELAPASELPLHLACYQRHGAQAVVHTHSTAATALSLLLDSVPAVHYQLAMFGGTVAVAPYATFGTVELAENVSSALVGRTAAIMKQHGTITLGQTLGKAYDGAQQLEWLCDVWLRASAVGAPATLPQIEIERVVRAFVDYGRPRQPSAQTCRTQSASLT